MRCVTLEGKVTEREAEGQSVANTDDEAAVACAAGCMWLGAKRNDDSSYRRTAKSTMEPFDASA